MMTLRPLTAVAALLFMARPAMSQVPDGQWVSYRDAYRAMVIFEKYGKAKHLIQNHLGKYHQQRGDAKYRVSTKVSPDGAHHRI